MSSRRTVSRRRSSISSRSHAHAVDQSAPLRGQVVHLAVRSAPARCVRCDSCDHADCRKVGMKNEYHYLGLTDVSSCGRGQLRSDFMLSYCSCSRCGHSSCRNCRSPPRSCAYWTVLPHLLLCVSRALFFFCAQPLTLSGFQTMRSVSEL